MRIEVSQIGSALEESMARMIIVGQPKGVGLTTSLMEFFVKKLFWDENFSVFILVDGLRTKNMIAELVEDFLVSAFDYTQKFDYEDNVLKVYNNVLSIISYSNNDLSIINNVNKNFKFNYSFVEKDSTDEMLNYYLTEYLPFCSEKIVIATYDTEDSIYYMPDIENTLKIVVYSELSKKNILMLKNKAEYTLETEQIIKGLFVWRQ